MQKMVNSSFLSVYPLPILPRQLAQGFANIQRFGPIILMVLLFVLPYLGIDIISWVMSPALSGLQKFILGVS